MVNPDLLVTNLRAPHPTSPHLLLGWRLGPSSLGSWVAASRASAAPSCCRAPAVCFENHGDLHPPPVLEAWGRSEPSVYEKAGRMQPRCWEWRARGLTLSSSIVPVRYQRAPRGTGLRPDSWVWNRFFLECARRGTRGVCAAERGPGPAPAPVVTGCFALSREDRSGWLSCVVMERICVEDRCCL